jgi:hypothetical protein
LGDRNDDYGDPKPDFERIATVFSGLLGEKLKSPITAAEIPLLMIGLKLCREMHKPKRDNMVDVAGYGLCHEWITTGAKPTA